MRYDGSLGRKTKSRAAAAASMLLAVFAATALWVAPVAAGDNANPLAQPGSPVYGKNLQEWMGTYLRWFLTGADAAQSMVGPVKLMPLPVGEYVSGSGTPQDPALYRGQLEITLRPGTPFVLPLSMWYAERYNNGTADDPAIPDDIYLAGVSPTFHVDGRKVISDQNERSFYVHPTAFDPIVVYPTPTSYGSYAALLYQGHGVVSLPLPVGRHVIHLYEPYLLDYPPFSFGVIYDNTWIVTVSPH
jgi:hypothetical protein